MRRWLTVFLMLFLPLQFSWAVAATYCSHEPKGAAAGHFGHHEHQHHAGADLAKDGKGKLADAVDGDCEVCHLGACEPILVTLPSVADTLSGASRFDYGAAYDSYVPPGLERPDRFLAA